MKLTPRDVAVARRLQGCVGVTVNGADGVDPYEVRRLAKFCLEQSQPADGCGVCISQPADGRGYFYWACRIIVGCALLTAIGLIWSLRPR